MAQSRLEKIGTIYSRTKSLLRGGAMKLEDKPLWYAIYEAFPPKVEPRYDREVPKTPIRQIFYEEDLIRAKFHKDCKFTLMSNLSNPKFTSNTQRFFAIYEELKQSGTSEEELYPKALEMFTAQAESDRATREVRREKIEHWGKAKNKDDETPVMDVDLKKIMD